MNRRNDKKRVVVTGIGMVTPLGNDTATSWQALLAGRIGVDTISTFDASGFTSRIAAQVKAFDPTTFIENQKILKYTTPFMTFALSAAEQAFADARIRPTARTAQRWGLVAGSGMMTADYEYWLRFNKEFAQKGVVDTHMLWEKGKGFFSAADFGKTTTNGCIGLLLQYYNIRGYSNSVHTACSSSGQALGLALQALRRGDSDYILAGGYDSMVSPIGLSSFCLLGALSTYNETPESASRPFDLTRNGFVLGEGAAFLVLELRENALARGAKIYAEFAGEGNSLSCYRITDSHPDGDGSRQAIQGALKDADVTIDQVDYINAHGTSTKIGDLGETNAIKAVFKERAKEIPTSSTKGQTGHLIAAAGAIEAAFCALSIDHAMIPMTANLKRHDAECDLDYVATGPRKHNVKVALSNSFGFGGSNSCLVFKA